MGSVLTGLRQSWIALASLDRPAPCTMNGFYIKYGKRILDILASLFGLIILSPFLLFITLLIKLSDPGPAFFTQIRIGQDFKPFRLIKFRSMVVDADRMGALVTSGDDPRITRIGRFLRKTKLDELPQLINVLRGDMSLVGPRPEVAKYIDVYRDDYKEILQVRPGITDYGAIEYRHEEEVLKQYKDPEEGYIKEVLPAKIKLYRKYISEVSFFTDMRLIFRTILHIIK